MLELTVDANGVRFGRRLKKAAVRAAQTAAEMEEKTGKLEASLLMTDDKTIRHLNKVYRDIDKVTDVLSFPSDEDVFLGDIALSLERAKQQAGEYGHSLQREVAFLVVHAMLHLLGYDHENEKGEASMRERQREILKQAGYER